jgi:hypothetical protein
VNCLGSPGKSFQVYYFFKYFQMPKVHLEFSIKLFRYLTASEVFCALTKLHFPALICGAAKGVSERKLRLQEAPGARELLLPHCRSAKSVADLLLKI